jgi:hypothetical protein
VTKLTRTQTREIAGWTGGVREDSEPALAVSGDGAGTLRAGENFVHQSGLRLVRRGGTARRLTFALNAISDVLAVGPFSPTGGLVVTHSAANARHYVHAITEEGAHALPIGAATEAGSRVVLPDDWNTASAARPQLVELFETAFLADRSDGTPRPLVAVTESGGALLASAVEADLDGNTVLGLLRPSGIAVHSSLLFAWGFEDEAIGAGPHVLRHSYLGRNPADATAWDPDAQAIIGAHGQPIRAARSGQGVLLVAKESELYRLTGTPDALPGWQFGVQQVDNSRGAGCANALALDVADNAWFGVGRAGPWRCDGANVELLRSGRSRSWSAVGDLSRAYVVHHPRRRAVCFGFVESSRGAGANTVQWWWDLDRDCWMPNQRPAVRVHMAASIAPTGIAASAAPSVLRQVLNNGAYQRTQLQLAWTLGRPDLATEVYLRSDSTAEQLVATVAAGIPGVVLRGLPPGVIRYARVRHVGAQATEFSAEIPVYTAVPSPRLAMPITPSYRITSDVAGPVQLLSENATENTLDTEVTVGAGVTLVVAPTPPRRSDTAALVLTASARRPDFPDAIEVSPEVFAASYGWRSAGVTPLDAALPIPTQVLDADAYTETAFTVQVCPHASVPQTIAVQWRRFGTGAWVTADLRALPAAAEPYTVTVPGLTAGERWGVRTVFDPIEAGVSIEEEFFTAIPAPQLVAGVMSGVMSLAAGDLDVTVTATPPNGAAGFDLLIGTIDQRTEALYQSVPGSPQAYTLAAAIPGRPTVLTCRARNLEWPVGLQWGAVTTLQLAVVEGSSEPGGTVVTGGWGGLLLPYSVLAG